MSTNGLGDYGFIPDDRATPETRLLGLISGTNDILAMLIERLVPALGRAETIDALRSGAGHHIEAAGQHGPGTEGFVFHHAYAYSYLQVLAHIDPEAHPVTLPAVPQD